MTKTRQTASPVYVRGTKTKRVKTARLQPGDVVLTADTGTPLVVEPTQTKTAAVLRTVKELQAFRTPATGFYGRAGRTYTIHFTDTTFSPNNAPIYTVHVVDKEA